MTFIHLPTPPRSAPVTPGGLQLAGVQACGPVISQIMPRANENSDD
jgi:hypothetical protein